MAAAAQLQGLKEEATCSICLEYFTEPVSVECGHAFCRSCITKCWEGLETNFPCPQCRETSQSKTLRPYMQPGNMVEMLKQLHLPNATPQEENLCAEHEEKLKLFCEDDQRPICVVCSMSRDHKPHTVLPIREAAQEYKGKLCSHMEHLKKELKDLHEWVEEESRKTSELEDMKSVLGRCSAAKALKPQEDAPGMEMTLQSIRRHAQLLAELQETFPVEMELRYVKSWERHAPHYKRTVNNPQGKAPGTRVRVLCSRGVLGARRVERIACLLGSAVDSQWCSTRLASREQGLHDENTWRPSWENMDYHYTRAGSPSKRKHGVLIKPIFHFTCSLFRGTRLSIS